MKRRLLKILDFFNPLYWWDVWKNRKYVYVCCFCIKVMKAGQRKRHRCKYDGSPNINKNRDSFPRIELYKRFANKDQLNGRL